MLVFAVPFFPAGHEAIVRFSDKAVRSDAHPAIGGDCAADIKTKHTELTEQDGTDGTSFTGATSQRIIYMCITEHTRNIDGTNTALSQLSPIQLPRPFSLTPAMFSVVFSPRYHAR
jgi:hypothetical protein